MEKNDQQKGGDSAPQEAAQGVSRRDFIKGGVAAGVAGGVGLGALYFGYGASVTRPVRVGFLGTGDEGGVLIGALNPEYVQVVAIADIRPYNVYRAFHGDESSDNAMKVRPGLLKKYGWPDETTARREVKVYTDRYEDLLEDADVEAVIIALPLHLHSVAAVKAMRRGKHVLTEKLMAHSVHECKEMARVAEATGKFLAVGHQRHYSTLYADAAEQIRRGVIGDVHHIRAQWHRGNLPGKDSWQQPLPNSSMEKELKKYATDAAKLLARTAKKKGFDAKLSKSRNDKAKAARIRKAKLLDKKVDAAKYGYQPKDLKDLAGNIKYRCSPLEELIRWRLWDRTGGGLMGELGSHQLDAASIFVSALRDDGKKVHPLSVTSVGGRHIFPLDRDVDDHVYCIFEFPGPEYFKDYDRHVVGDKNKVIGVTYSSINGNGFGGFGETVMGTNGTLEVFMEQAVNVYPRPGKSKTRLEVSKSGGGPTMDTTESGGVPVAAKTSGDGGPISRGYTEEIEHWAWCIRNPDAGDRPRCHAEVGLADAVIALTANKAIREQHRIDFKPEWFDFRKDDTPEDVKPDINSKRYQS